MTSWVYSHKIIKKIDFEFMDFDIWRSVLISFGKEAHMFGWIPNAVDLTTKQIKFNSVSQKAISRSYH